MSRKRKQQTQSVDKVTPVFAPLEFGDWPRRLLSLLFPLAAIGAGLLYLLPMTELAGGPGLPFDEAYIPLDFARSLITHGVYAVHHLDPVSTGATSALQVLLLAVGGLFTEDFVLLSQLFGILCFAVAAFLMFRLGLLLFRRQQWMAVAAALLFVLSPRFASAAMSGLPTLLLIVLLLASATAYFGRRPMLFFLFAGLALWVRPDAIVFMFAAIVHLVYSHAGVKPELRKEQATGRPVTAGETRIGGIIYVLLLASYVVFNLIVGNGMLPDAVSATMAYYGNMTTDYLGEVQNFFSWSWSTLMLLFALFGLLPLIAAVLRRHPAPMLMSFTYVLASVVLFWFFHPVIRDYYVLLPTLPFFILIALWGLERLIGMLAGALPFLRMPAAVLALGLVLVAAGFAISDWLAFRGAHYKSVNYLIERHAKMGLWASFNTPADTRIATNVPGTVSYYGDRAVLDMKGAVSPEVLSIIGDLPALVQLLDSQDIKYIVTTRDEFEVVNINPIVSSDLTEPGIIEAFRYVPTRTHIMSQRASALNMEAVQLMQQKRFKAAANVLQRSLQEDPESSRSNTLLAIASLQLKDTTTAIDQLRKALLLHPHFAAAMVPLGDVLMQRHEWDEGLALLEKAVKLYPQSAQAQASLENAQKLMHEDSLRAKGGGTYTFTIEQ
ncbi:tetratricopeptide repeat protein [bacterium]|nr:tetratricopeptide repeat protein [bacterium]